MALKTKEILPSEFLACTILNTSGEKLTVRDALNQEDTLLVLIRHFGCIGCTEQMLAIAPKLPELQSLGVKVKIIGNGEARYIDGFIKKFNLQNTTCEIYTDPSLKVYEEAHLKRSFFKVFHPRTIVEFIQSWRKGIGQNSIQGDNFQLGGTLLVDQDYCLHYYFQNESITGIADPNKVMNEVHKFVLRNNKGLI